MSRPLAMLALQRAHNGMGHRPEVFIVEDRPYLFLVLQCGQEAWIDRVRITNETVGHAHVCNCQLSRVLMVRSGYCK